MKVFFVVTRGDTIGGAQVHVRDLAAALVADGHEVAIAAGGARALSSARDAGARIYDIPTLVRSVSPLDDVRALRAIRAAILDFAPDIVSTHSSKAGILGRFAAAGARVPVLFTAHGWAFTDGVGSTQARLYTNVERFMARRSDQIVTVSDFDRDLALRRRVAAPALLRRIHNGMRDADGVLRADPSREPANILMVARFEPQKDHDTLLRALAKLRDLAWSVRFVGDGPLMDAVQQTATRLGIADRVSLLGARNDVAALMADAQIYVLATNWEGLPRSIIEAMRAGLPVIATDVGGVNEMIRDGENGLLMPRGNVDALARGLRRLIEDPSIRTRMGAASRNTFVEGFTFARMFEQTTALYREVISRRASA